MTVKPNFHLLFIHSLTKVNKQKFGKFSMNTAILVLGLHGYQKTLFKDLNTLFSYKRIEVCFLKEGKLGALECIVHCVTQERKHLAVTIDIVDSHPLFVYFL